MSVACAQADRLARARERFPWPIHRPDVPPIDWTLDYGGRKLVTNCIRKPSARIVVEVGCFLGGSVRTWLKASPNVHVIAIDAWQWNDPVPALLKLASPEILAQLRAPDGFYETFLSNLWTERARVIPMRRRSPDALHELAELGVTPDVVYLDADKKGRELEIIHELFPNAWIAGDDWFWGREQGYPARQPIRDFCRRHGFHLRTHKMTWIIERRPIGMLTTVRDRLADASWCIRQLACPTKCRPRFRSSHVDP